MLGVLVSTIACLEYSPHVLTGADYERSSNTKAVARILARPAPEVLRFAVVGDTQLCFDETADAIASLSRRDDLAFVIQVGDFTNFGIGREFELMYELFGALPVPYLVVIGIHDYLGNGEELFDDVFGRHDLAFTFARTRFVLFDSNSREFAFDGTVPDLAWLAREAAPGPGHDRTVFVSHIAPNDGDFDPALRDAYLALVRAAAPAISLHGHLHAFRSEVVEGVPIVVADAMQGRSYLVVTVTPDGAFDVERVGF
jgi:3',5'-cyclic-AMP phosphodiesterase